MGLPRVPRVGDEVSVLMSVSRDIPQEAVEALYEHLNPGTEIPYDSIPEWAKDTYRAQVEAALPHLASWIAAGLREESVRKHSGIRGAIFDWAQGRDRWRWFNRAADWIVREFGGER